MDKISLKLASFKEFATAVLQTVGKWFIITWLSFFNPQLKSTVCSMTERKKRFQGTSGIDGNFVLVHLTSIEIVHIKYLQEPC